MINPDHIPESPAHRRLRLLLEEHGHRRGLAEGEAKGLAQALLVILETRGLTVTPAERARITACKEPARLTLWARQALSAASVDEALSDVGSTPPQRARLHRRRRSNGA